MNFKSFLLLFGHGHGSYWKLDSFLHAAVIRTLPVRKALLNPKPFSSRNPSTRLVLSSAVPAFTPLKIDCNMLPSFPPTEKRRRFRKLRSE